MDVTSSGLRVVVLAFGVVALLAGAGWAVYGDEIFLSILMAGIAGCL